MRLGSLCSGYGGLDLACEQVFAAQTVWHCETDPDASMVLRANFPDVPNHGSIVGADWRRVEPVDVLAAGFPCQPVSSAGQRRGTADARWLWPYVHRAVLALTPGWLVLENVENIASARMGVLPGILSDLIGAGYRCRWAVVGACAVGSCHHRHRWFLVARRASQGSAERTHPLKCGAPRGGRAPALLPTPIARDGHHRSDTPWNHHRHGRRNGLPLGAVLRMLPTPWTSRFGQNESAEVWSARNAELAKRRTRGASGMSLGVALQLLPTPMAAEGTKGSPNQSRTRGGNMLSSAVIGERFERYAPAVERWQDISGLPVPDHTEPSRTGTPRLAAPFAEWMMGLPAGWVTGHLSRIPALRAIGNGVVPAQAAGAVQALLPQIEAAPPLSDT